MKIKLIALLAFVMASSANAQNTEGNLVNVGLDRHDFFYTGQSHDRYLYKIKDGKVIWEFHDPDARGEISDAIPMSDGNVLIAHQHGLKEINSAGETLWKIDCIPNTEIHTAQPIGLNKVLYIQNGDPLKAIIMEVPSCEIIKEIALPTPEKISVHGQVRNCILSKEGTLLLAHMQMKKLFEIDSDGNIINEWGPFPLGMWGVQELDNGNLLLTGNKGLVQEINRQGDVVWQFQWLQDGRYPVVSTQKSYRLNNGNTIMTNWHNEWNAPVDRNNPTVQAIEITPDGRIVWELNSWSPPMDLGPATTFIPLDSPVNRCDKFFGEFRPSDQEIQLNEWSLTKKPRMCVAPNQPLGEGIGINPGRVAWVHAPGVANWDGETGLWVEDKWNDQYKADRMVTEAITSVAAIDNPTKAWQAIFRNFNKTHGRGNHPYKKGEKIAIKLNMNNVLTHRDTVELNSSPFVTLALIRSLVNDGKVLPEDICICEPSRTIPDSIYDKVNREFPAVRFVDNIGGDGREKCEYYPDQVLYSIDNGKMARGLAKCIVDADYVINSALLKTHKGPGVTLTGKNWYGATDISLFWRQNAHDNISQDKRNGNPQYKTFVDWMGHKDLGGKCLLYIIDGTYASRDVNGAPNPKWLKPPFNDDWCCSLLVSQDGVAVDAVAMDLIIGEWPDFGSLNFCDEYLREAATIPNPVTGVVYDPERDGKPLTKPLGLFEHWNNPVERKYTKLDMIYKKID